VRILMLPITHVPGNPSRLCFTWLDVMCIAYCACGGEKRVNIFRWSRIVDLPWSPVTVLKKQSSMTIHRFFEVTVTSSKAVDSNCQGSLTAAICSAQSAPLATSHHLVHRGLGRQVALQTANTSTARDKRPQSKRAQTFCSLLQREACGALFLSRSRADACPQCNWMTTRLPLQIC
jgi:hypothetical protein